MTIDELFLILTMNNPSRYLLSKEDDLFKLIPDLKKCKNFNQHNERHPYDVYTHILKVVDGVDNNLPTRLAALFHDVGKPHTFRFDENGVGHMRGHWEVSKTIFNDFAIKNNINDNLKELVEKLILYHDINVGKFSEEQLLNFVQLFSEEEMFMLYDIKRADLKAQNSKFHYLLDEYTKQQVQLFKYYDQERIVMQDDFKKIILGTSSIDNCKSGNKVLIDDTNIPFIPRFDKLVPRESTVVNYKNRLIEYKDNIELYKQQIEDEYIKYYYNNRLKHLNINSLLTRLYDKYGDNIILVTKENIVEFSNRRVLADYLELLTNIYVPEIIIDKDNNIERVNPIRYKQRIKKIIKK